MGVTLLVLIILLPSWPQYQSYMEGYPVKEIYPALGRVFLLNMLIEFSLGPALRWGWWIMLPLFLIGLIPAFKERFMSTVVMVLPPALMLIILHVLNVLTYSRYFFFFLPMGLIILSRGLVWITEVPRLGLKPAQRYAALLIIGILLLGLSFPSLILYHRLGKQGFKDAAEKLASLPDITVLSIGLSSREFLFYLPDAIPANHPADLENARSSGKTVWVVGSFPGSYMDTCGSYLGHHTTEVYNIPSGTEASNMIYLYRLRR